MIINSFLSTLSKYDITFHIDEDKVISISNMDKEDKKCEYLEIDEGIHRVSIAYSSKLSESIVEKNLLTLLLHINPTDIVKVFSKNIIHDVKGPLHLSSTAINMEKNNKISKDQMVEILEGNMEELTKSIDMNRSLLGLYSPELISKDRVLEEIEKLTSNYRDISFNVSINSERKINKKELEQILNLIFKNILVNYMKEVKIEINDIEDQTYIKISIEKDLSQFLDDLILFNNKKIFHGLGFLRFVSNNISIKKGIENSITCYFKQK